jgi:hypothetical protein
MYEFLIQTNIPIFQYSIIPIFHLDYMKHVPLKMVLFQ